MYNRQNVHDYTIYLQNTKGIKVYIAAQGPKTSTVEDFMLMIWQQKCHTIVMLANLIENGRGKCVQYWPNLGQPTATPNFDVRLTTTKQFACYERRVMVLKHRKSGQELQLQHFHFTKWPDHGTPDALELVMFHRHVKRCTSGNEGPMIVHCSAGIGRTGTLIALDALLEAAQTNSTIDVQGYIETMRKDRMNMIQNVFQYKVLHSAIAEALCCPDMLQSKTTFLNLDDSDPVPINQSKIKNEFQTLQDIKLTIEKGLAYTIATTDANRAKNRSPDILAADQYRQQIFAKRPGRTNYINAVKVPSFRKNLKYLVTQYPLEDTVVDFWAVVMEQCCSAIVCLGDPLSTPKAHCWWPTGSAIIRKNPYEIKHVSDETEDYNIIVSHLDVADKDSGSSRRVKLFHVKSWADSEFVPSNPGILCKLHYLVDDWLMASGGEGPITVTCLDGARCSGLYCLISTCMERLDMMSEIDVCVTTRQLQIRRPQFIDVFEQYQYVYDSIRTFSLTADNTYANETTDDVYQNC